jgi:hypothetical protein
MFFIFLSSDFLYYFHKILGHIALNVRFVCDVFAVALMEREAFQQPQKCGWSEPWERSDLGERNPGGRRPERIQSCYATYHPYSILILFIFFQNFSQIFLYWFVNKPVN